MIALVGNPNCGKTTLFNRLTHSGEKVGNRMGVTTKVKIGMWGKEELADLPGVYSLFETKAEERETEKILSGGKIDGILNIIDATNIERSLKLTVQLSSLGIPMIIALNMTDLLEISGFEINSEIFSECLGTNIVMISAANGKGCELLEHVEMKIPEKIENSEIWIKETVKKILKKKGENILLERSIKIDKILLGKFALPLFLFIMGAVFWMTFGSPGQFLGNMCSGIFGKFLLFTENILAKSEVNVFLKSLVCRGILQSLGSIVPFFPQIMILFLCISFMEDTGYMSRAVFLAEVIMSKVGLDGKAFVPLMTGLGCSVPAVMSTENIDNKEQKNLIINLIPFIPCSAKILVFIIFSSVFFHKKIIIWFYVLSKTVAFLYAAVFGKKTDDRPFVMELPPYRRPTWRNTLIRLSERVSDFIKRAGSILFIAGIAIWFLENFTFSLRMTDVPEASILGRAGAFFAPVFIPCGFGTWQAVVSLMSGLIAKEAIVSTLSVVYKTSDFIAAFTPASAAAFMVFVLFYPPCIASVAEINSKISVKKTIVLLIRQFCIAWISAFVVYVIFSGIY